MRRGAHRARRARDGSRGGRQVALAQRGHCAAAPLVRRASARAGPSRSGSVAAIRCAPDPPSRVVGEMLRRACQIAEGEPLEARQRKLRERVARRVRQDRAKPRRPSSSASSRARPFPIATACSFERRGRMRMLMSDQVRSAWLDFVGAECKAGPVVLVLEDLHWGDLPTVKLVDAALRDLENGPLMVLAFARPEVHDLFPKLWEEREVQQVRLGGLTKKAAERLAREVLGPEVAAETVAKVVERADGNAFYLEELIRAVAEGRGAELPGNGGGHGRGAPRQARSRGAARPARGKRIRPNVLEGERRRAARRKSAPRRMAARAHRAGAGVASAPPADFRAKRSSRSGTRSCATAPTRCSPTTTRSSATCWPAIGSSAWASAMP